MWNPSKLLDYLHNHREEEYRQAGLFSVLRFSIHNKVSVSVYAHLHVLLGLKHTLFVSGKSAPNLPIIASCRQDRVGCARSDSCIIIHSQVNMALRLHFILRNKTLHNPVGGCGAAFGNTHHTCSFPAPSWSNRLHPSRLPMSSWWANTGRHSPHRSQQQEQRGSHPSKFRQTYILRTIELKDNGMILTKNRTWVAHRLTGLVLTSGVVPQWSLV